MTYAQNSATAANVIGLPILTIGPKKGSGASFDPGTNPTTGDTLGTDCAAAFQAALNAAVAAPYSVAAPAVIQFLPGFTYKFWNAGTTPTSILIQSGDQSILGAFAKNPVNLSRVGSSQASITPPASTVAYTNASGGTLYVRIIPGTETSGSATTTGLTVTAYNGATATPVTGIYILANGDTLTPTYAGGTPTMDSSLPFIAFGVQPASWNIRGLLIKGTGIWADTLDSAFNPTGAAGAGAYAETGGNLFMLDNVHFATPIADDLVTNLMLDGMEAGCMLQCQGVDFHWCVPGGTLNIIGGVFTSMSILSQNANLYSVNLNAPITIPNNSAQGNNMSSFASLTFPAVFNFNGVYFNGGGGTFSYLVKNGNTTSNTVININGGYWKSTGTLSGGTGFIQGNEATTAITIAGGTTFTRHGNLPLVGVAPLSCVVNGAISIVDSVTAAQFFANTQYALNAAAALAGFSSPSVIATSIQNAKTNAAPTSVAVTPVSAIGIYEASGYVEVTTGTTIALKVKVTYGSPGGTDPVTDALVFTNQNSATLLTSLIAAGRYYFSHQFHTDNSGTAITFADNAGTYTTCVYNLSYVLRRLA